MAIRAAIQVQFKAIREHFRQFVSMEGAKIRAWRQFAPRKVCLYKTKREALAEKRRHKGMRVRVRRSRILPRSLCPSGMKPRSTASLNASSTCASKKNEKRARAGQYTSKGGQRKRCKLQRRATMSQRAGNDSAQHKSHLHTYRNLDLEFAPVWSRQVRN